MWIILRVLKIPQKLDRQIDRDINRIEIYLSNNIFPKFKTLLFQLFVFNDI